MMETITPGDEAVTIQNGGETPVDVTLNVFGVPQVPEPAGGNGYAISRAYYTMDGIQVDPSNVRQNDRMVVVLTVEDLAGRVGDLIVDDPLPAGFAIDNPNLLRSGDVQALDWLSFEENPDNVEFRRDRFVAALRIQGEPGTRRQLAYSVRATSAGSFAHPAALVEDMYRPEFRAITGTGRVNVAKAQ